MQRNSTIFVGGFTLFSILSAIRSINLPEQQQQSFVVIWLFILFPIAGFLSAIPLGYNQIGIVKAGTYSVYTALMGQFSHWIVFQSLDGESFLMTCALTIIGLGIGDLFFEKRQKIQDRQIMTNSRQTPKK